jgi:DNA-binding beta-propeller fold protein YncE
VFPTADAYTRTLYVPGADGTTMAVIDMRACNARVTTGCSAPAATVEAGQGPLIALVDPGTRMVYVNNEDAPQVAIVDGARCNASDTSGCDQMPVTTVVGPASDAGLALLGRALYVPARDADTLAVIDTARCNARITAGCDTRWPTLQTGNEPAWVEPDAATRSLYVSGYADDSLAVLDARACCRNAPSVFVDDAFSIAISQKAHTAYVTHANLHELAMFDTTRCSARRPENCTSVVGPVPGVSGPFDIAFDPGTDTLYATNQDDRTVVLIDPAKCNARRPSGCAPVGPAIHLSHAAHVSIDPASHAIYVASAADETISVIDGRRCNVRDFSGCTATAVPAGPAPHAVAADPLTGTVYVSNLQQEGTVTVLDGARIRATIPVGSFPQKLEVDATARKLYVANSAFGEEPGSLSVVDLRACNRRDTSGCGRAAPRVATGRTPWSLAIDPTTHTVYTADLNHSTSTVIRAGRKVESAQVGYFPWDVAVDPVAKTVYVTDNFEGRVSFVPTR